MKRVILIALVVFGGFSVKAQIQAIVLDTICTDCPSAGYTCVQIVAQMTHPTDVISTVFGLEDSPLSITTDCPDCFYSSVVGSNTGDQINCDLFPFFPDLQYDTWVTIGKQCSSDPGGAVFTLQSPNQPWIPIGCSIEMNDIYGGAWFTTPDQINAQAGADLNILLGQFTTCGNLEGCLNAQVFIEYAGSGSPYIEQNDLCFSSSGCINAGCTDPEAINYQVDACLDNGFCLYTCDLHITGATVTPPTCSYNSNGMVDINAAGAQGILRYYKNGATPNLTGIYNSLGNATYTFTMKDERFDDPSYNPGYIYGTCTKDTVIVLNTAPIAFTMGTTTNVTCNGLSNGCKNATVTGGTGTITYTMSNCAGTSFILDSFGNPVVVDSPTYCGFPSGSWKYVATDANGCVFNSACFSITQPPALNINDIFVDNATCGNTPDGGVNMQFLGGTGDVDYYINDVFYENNFITGLLPGTYTILGVDVNGCTDTDTFTIGGPTPVVATATSSATLCVGTSDGCVSINATGGNTGPHTYSINGVNFTTNGTFCGLAAGEYTAYAHDSQGCADTLQITVGSAPALDANVEVSGVECNGDANGSVTVTGQGGTPGYTYSIDGVNYSANNTFNNLSPGSVTIYVLDNNDCPLETSADITEPDVLELAIEVEDVVCNGEENGQLVVDVNGGTADFDYYLEGILQTGNVITGLGADTYTVTVVDANGCEVQQDATIDEPADLVLTFVGSTDETAIGANDGTISIDVAGGTMPYTYEWTDSNGNVVSASQDPTNLPPGTYNVVVTDANGCDVSLNTDVLIDDSIIELGTNISLQVNPNPTNGIFVLTLTGLQGEKLSYRIADARGRVIAEKQFGNSIGVKTEEIDLSTYEGGMYYLTVIAGDSSKAVKVVKE